MRKGKIGTQSQLSSNVYGICSRSLSKAIREVSLGKIEKKIEKKRTGGKPKMTDDDVIEARRLHEKLGASCVELAEKYNMTYAAMYKILDYTTRSKHTDKAKR